MAALVRLDGVTKRFETASGARTAVDDVTLDVEEGEVLGVIGYSGAGKSTLVRLINGLEQPTSGTVTYRGRALTSLTEAQLREERRGIGMIFQQFNLFSSRTVAGNVAFPLRLAKMAKGERDARVARMLDFVGLLDLAHAHPEELSGGQKQRVGIARALATDPRLLLADEATSALDPETTAEVLALLRRVNEELGVTIVVITHEMDAVRRVADRVAVMQHGRVVEHGAVYDVFASPASDTAARFVRSVLHDRPGAEVLRGIRERHTGRLVTVRIGEGDAGVGRVTAAFAARGVPTEIVYGGIGEVRGRTLGALTYATDGASADVDAVLAELRAAGFVVIEESGVDEHDAGEPVGPDQVVSGPVVGGPVSSEQGERRA